MRSIDEALLGSILGFLVSCIGCDHQQPSTINAEAPNKEAADAIGLRIADLLSVKCADGYHFASLGHPEQAYAGRGILMESAGVPEGNNKFLGYEWIGDFTLGPTAADNKLHWGTGYRVFMRRGRWYLNPNEHDAPVPVDDLRSIAPDCPH